MLFWESKLIHKLRGKTAVPNLHFVGDEKTEDGKSTPVDLKVGDHVVFGQYGGNTVKIDGEELLILNESEIYGVIK